MKKKTKKRVQIITIIVFIWLFMFTTDLVRVHKNLSPIFSMSFADYDVSSGYVGYTGLFYRVERNLIEVDGSVKRTYDLFPWFIE